MKIRPHIPAVAVLVAGAALGLSACGGDDSDTVVGDIAGEAADRAADAAGGAGGEIDGTLGIAAEQIARQLKAADYALDGTTLTYTLDEDALADGTATPDQTASGFCQIARTVLEAVAPGEVDALVLAYPSETVDCAEYV